MATPHVSAVLAAMFHLNPRLTAYQARDVLLDPSSYDPITDARALMTSTGGRLNFAKAIASPRLTAPVSNNFPTITGVSNVEAAAGTMVDLTAIVSDPDNDPLRTVWTQAPWNSAPGATSLWLLRSMYSSIFPTTNGSMVSFQAPSLARPAIVTYGASVSDGRGGGATALAYTSILPSAAPGLPPTGTLTVSPTSGSIGTVVTVNFPVADPEGDPVAWDLWQTGLGGAAGYCCMTGSSYNLPFSYSGVFRLTVQAIDGQLNFSNRQSTVVRIGGATGTPPIAGAVFDRLSGTAPLTVSIDMSSSIDPDGTIQQYIIECTHGASGTYFSGPKGTCVYDKPGNYWILLKVKDNAGLMDVLSAYAVVTPPISSGKTPATVTLGNMTQTYTGNPLTPTATTNPPGLAITWTNAPQTQVGSYSVTASVNDPNYVGSASGTFIISNNVKSTASVTLSNLTQTYMGSPLMPTATTNPAGLAITWTNAPQTAPGSYSVMATVNDPNYEASASGTFVIVASSTPPSVSITSPGAGAVPAGPITVQAAVVQGTNPIAHVDFLVNGTVKCSDTGSPYTCGWNVPSAKGKSYQLQVKAYDTAGQVGTSPIVTVTH